jgi:DNA-binding MarR family transcriptional regulator
MLVSVSDLSAWAKELDRLERMLGQIGPDEVCCEGLTPRQTAILRTLAAQEGARLSDLAQASGISPSAMTRVLEKLEKQELVQRVRGSQPDGRAAMVRITPRGRQVRRRIDQLMQDRIRVILDAIPAAERAAILRALATFNSALERAGCCCAPVAPPLSRPVLARQGGDLHNSSEEKP